MRVSQNWGYLLGVPVIRTIVYLGLCLGPPILGNYHIGITTMANVATYGPACTERLLPQIAPGDLEAGTPSLDSAGSSQICCAASLIK